VSETASRHAPLRPPLDEISLRAFSERPHRWSEFTSGDDGTELDANTDDGPAALLWAALFLAAEEGVPVADLVIATGMSHRWVNYRLRALADAGRVIQIRRGVWRAADPDSDAQ